MTAHRLHVTFSRRVGSVAIDYRTHASGVGIVQMADQERTKIDGVDAQLEWFESETTAHEGFADKTLPPAPLDLAVAANLTLWPRAWIAQQDLAAGSPPASSAIPLDWQFLAKRLMRSNPIVGIDPTGGAMLLPLARDRRRVSRLRLEHPVHLLVTAVVFGMARPRQLHPDAQSHPSGTQTRQAGRAGRGKWATIVGANDLRQAIPAEQLPEHRLDRTPT